MKLFNNFEMILVRFVYFSCTECTFKEISYDESNRVNDLNINSLYIEQKEKQKIENEAKKQNKHNSKIDVLEDRLKTSEIKVGHYVLNFMPSNAVKFHITI